MVLETLVKSCLTDPEFLEKLFLLQKLRKWANNWPKIGFFDFKEKFVINFHWICSIMKSYIICCDPAQILGKILFLRYRSKRCQPMRLQGFSINYFSTTNRWYSLIFYMLIKIHKQKNLIENFLVGNVQKFGVANLVSGI